MDIKTVLENTTPEQREKAHQCKTAEELKQFAKDENIDISAEDVAELYIAIHNKTGEISDDDLDNVAGGKGEGGAPTECLFCHSTENIRRVGDVVTDRFVLKSHKDQGVCDNCIYKFYK